MSVRSVATVVLSLVLLLLSDVARAGSTLVLGRISDDPKAHYQQLKPLLDYVVPRMRSVGITSGNILMARDAQQMASYLRRGHVDWVTETAGTAMTLASRANAQPLLLTERNGARSYHSVVFARRDSTLRTLADLRGRTLALQAPSSTSAYVIPVLDLLDAGLSLEMMHSPQDRPQVGNVGYVLARTELNISTYVHKGLTDAGVVSSIDWSSPSSMPAAFRKDFRIVHESAPYPRAVEMVRADLPPAVRDRLQEVLLQASTDPVAGPALQAFFGTSGFHRVDPASRQRLESIRGGVARIREAVE